MTEQIPPPNLAAQPAPIIFRSTRTMALWANAFVCGYTLMNLAVAGGIWWAAQTPRDPRYGYLNWNGPVVAADRFTGAAALAWYLAMPIAGTGVAVLLWRMRSNADQMSSVRSRLGPTWVVFAWIVPIASLWLPYLVVSHILRASDPDLPPQSRVLLRSKSWIVPAWWVSFVSSCALNVVWLVHRAASIPIGQSAMKTSADLRIADSVVTICATVLWLVCVRRIRAAQDERAQRMVATFPGIVVCRT